MKLNIGAGDVPLDGYTPVDRKIGSEAYPLKYADGSADEIRASHILEHFAWADLKNVLADWRRVLKPGGVLKIAVPNMKYIANHLDEPATPFYLMGGQTDANDFHKSAFTEKSLCRLLTDAGFVDIEQWQSEVKDCASLPVSLNLKGVKADTMTAAELRAEQSKIAAVISMPRLGFTENFSSIMQALPPLGIEVTTVTGAFWGQCLERGLSMHMDDGTEWILTLDYDTVFNRQTVQQLLTLMADHPDADAIAPVQVHREADYALMALENDKGERVTQLTMADLNKPLLRASWMHFGLTLFRVSALKKMKHPWFLGIPNADGVWGEGRTDDDIYFWRKWKEAGNTAYIAPGARVGHLQLMVSWPDTNFTPIHQFVSEYRKVGPPRISPLETARAPHGAPSSNGACGKAVA